MHEPPAESDRRASAPGGTDGSSVPSRPGRRRWLWLVVGVAAAGAVLAGVVWLLVTTVPQGDYDEATASLAATEAEVVRLQQRSAELEAGAESLESEVQRLADEAANLREDNDRLTTDAETVRAENEELTAEAQGLRDDNEQLTADAESARVEIEEVTAVADSLRDDNEQLTADVAALRTESERSAESAEDLRDAVSSARLAAAALALVDLNFNFDGFTELQAIGVDTTDADRLLAELGYDTTLRDWSQGSQSYVVVNGAISAVRDERLAFAWQRWNDSEIGSPEESAAAMEYLWRLHLLVLWALDGGGSDREAFVAAGMVSLGSIGDAGECIVESIVDGVGVDTLNEAGLTPETLWAPEAPLADAGLTADSPELTAVAEGITRCDRLLESFAASAGETLTDEQLSCMEDGGANDLVGELLALSLIGADTTELDEQGQTLGTECGLGD